MKIEGDAQFEEHAHRVVDLFGVVLLVGCQIEEGACIGGIDECCFDGRRIQPFLFRESSRPLAPRISHINPIRI